MGIQWINLAQDRVQWCEGFYVWDLQRKRIFQDLMDCYLTSINSLDRVIIASELHMLTLSGCINAQIQRQSRLKLSRVFGK